VGQAFLLQENFDTSHMLIAYNPIMALSLIIQFLRQIRYDYNVLDMECLILINKFQTLGRLIIEHMRFDNIENIFTQKDFKDRPVL